VSEWYHLELVRGDLKALKTNASRGPKYAPNYRGERYSQREPKMRAVAFTIPAISQTISFLWVSVLLPLNMSFQFHFSGFHHRSVLNHRLIESLLVTCLGLFPPGGVWNDLRTTLAIDTGQDIVPCTVYNSAFKSYPNMSPSYYIQRAPCNNIVSLAKSDLKSHSFQTIDLYVICGRMWIFACSRVTVAFPNKTRYELGPCNFCQTENEKF